MPVAHRHEHLEVNLPTGGAISYLLGGRRFDVPAGTMAIFWASIPHQLINAEPNTTMHWLHLPIGTALAWRLPTPVVKLLLNGRPVLVGEQLDGSLALAEHGGRESRMFHQWATDVHDVELRAIAVLEMEAMMRRLAHREAIAAHSGLAAASGSTGADHISVSRATLMAQYVADNSRDPITVDDVARALHLSPNYAMTLFRRVIGQTIGAYLTACRIAEAQRLLLTTNAPVSEVAALSGFGSTSRFYASFTEACEVSPGSYRRYYRG
ncbi:helix-turn-helix domain-containing protein [Cryobacterium sp. TMT2-15-1]|uniref:helix-turn-helix domain-containing protein n=1 Tax=Cryobacterium sp. TMT2-15-1 TaxID=1259246 RepID=UPI00141BBD4E|nr:helix-turn-helix domain-containing protein [Cryobacterium sp. TMT2-15-1]